MTKLQQRLKNEIQKNRHVKIVCSREWCIPVRTVEVTYKPIRRSTMDILMKMVLISIQEADFKESQELSELLVVDRLFIEDLITKMLRVRLLEKVEDYFRLTEKGKAQLEKGIFEEELDIERASMLYSPCHETFLQGDIEKLEEFDELPALYRYVEKDAEQIDTFEDTLIIEALLESKQDEEEEKQGENQQEIIETIISAEASQINDIPCQEFIVFDEEKDLLYVRVWNTLTQQWDEYLEQQISTNEKTKWREQYL